MTKTVTKEEFETFVAANARGEPRVERDVEYGYECFDDADGTEIAFASHHSHKGSSYFIRTDEDAE